MAIDDLFSGTWAFTPSGSHLDSPTPKLWVQRIAISAGTIAVSEEIVTAAGDHQHVSVDAQLDGQECAVSGSPVADTMSYTLRDAHTITGTGRKNGATSLTTTASVSEEGRLLTLRYAVFSEGREVATGLAHFKRV
jgi:hypothetical protein